MSPHIDDELSVIFDDDNEFSHHNEKKKKKKGLFSRNHHDSDDDNDDVYDDEYTPKKKKSSSKIIPLAMVGLLLVALGIGVATQSGDSQDNTAQPKDNAPSSVDVQLVNLQQVAWSDNMCSVVGKWSQKKIPLNTHGKQLNPVKARKVINSNIDKNIQRINSIAHDVDSLPDTSLSHAKELEKNTTIIDNNKKVGNEVDSTVDELSRTTSSTLHGYASALDEVKKNLNSIADYNFNGLRDGISSSGKNLDNINKQLSDSFAKMFESTTFDNLATQQAISHIESCNGSVINSEELNKQKNKEIKDMEVVNNVVVKNRCQQYLDNTKNISQSDNVEKNRQLCSEALQNITIDNDNPLSHAHINTHNDERVDVSRMQNESSSSSTSTTQTSNKKEEKGTQKTSSHKSS